MNYTIEFVILCEQGKRRKINQDNFWHNGQFLDSENNGLTLPIINSTNTLKLPVFAVFDGMGGEKYGEVAAYLAAKALNQFYAKDQKSNFTYFLSAACERMNTAICSFALDNKTERMGTTTAILAFGKKKIYVCNIGDSKIFLYGAKKLSQITHDHVVYGTSNKKPPLAQHLGVQKSEFIIEPYLAVGKYNNGDKYLICTDGLTDMVSNSDIDAIISEQKPVAEIANDLMEKALSSGGTDNITIILCEIKQEKFSLKNIFGRKLR